MDWMAMHWRYLSANQEPRLLQWLWWTVQTSGLDVLQQIIVNIHSVWLTIGCVANAWEEHFFFLCFEGWKLTNKIYYVSTEFAARWVRCCFEGGHKWKERLLLVHTAANQCTANSSDSICAANFTLAVCVRGEFARPLCMCYLAGAVYMLEIVY